MRKGLLVRRWVVQWPRHRRRRCRRSPRGGPPPAAIMPPCRLAANGQPKRAETGPRDCPNGKVALQLTWPSPAPALALRQRCHIAAAPAASPEARSKFDEVSTWS